VAGAADNHGAVSTARRGDMPAIHTLHWRGAASARLRQPWLLEVVRVNAKDVLGQQGEQIAASFLADAGLMILERNWRCKEGEIDIVAVEGKTLVICEVKTRSGLRFGSPIEVITRQKAWRLRKLAVLWVNAHDVIFEEIRIDIVGVLRAVSGEFTVEHVPGVG
jgi:putative endonuclease